MWPSSEKRKSPDATVTVGVARSRVCSPSSPRRCWEVTLDLVAAVSLASLLSIALSTICIVSVDARCINGEPVDYPGNCTTCRKGWFGPSCSQACLCTKGTCREGVLGDGSCSSCWPRFFGDLCQHKCACALGTCDNAPSTGTGQCTSCTWDGLAMPLCEACTANRFGVTCERECTCSSHGVCDGGFNGTGRCVKGSCAAGWFGRRCDSPTPIVSRTVTLPAPTLAPRPPSPTDPINPSDGPPTPIPVPRPVLAVTLHFAAPPVASDVAAFVGLVSGAPAAHVFVAVGVAAAGSTNDGAPPPTDAAGPIVVPGSPTEASVRFSPVDAPNTVQQYFAKLLVGLRSGAGGAAALLRITGFTIAYIDATRPPPTPAPVATPVPDPGAGRVGGSGAGPLPNWATAAVAVLAVGLVFASVFAVWRAFVARRDRAEAERAEAARAEAAAKAEAGALDAARLELLRRDMDGLEAGVAAARGDGAAAALPATAVPEEEEMDFFPAPRVQFAASEGGMGAPAAMPGACVTASMAFEEETPARPLGVPADRAARWQQPSGRLDFEFTPAPAAAAPGAARATPRSGPSPGAVPLPAPVGGSPPLPPMPPPAFGGERLLASLGQLPAESGSAHRLRAAGAVPHGSRSPAEDAVRGVCEPAPSMAARIEPPTADGAAADDSPGRRSGGASSKSAKRAAARDPRVSPSPRVKPFARGGDDSGGLTPSQRRSAAPPLPTELPPAALLEFIARQNELQLGPPRGNGGNHNHNKQGNRHNGAASGDASDIATPMSQVSVGAPITPMAASASVVDITDWGRQGGTPRTPAGSFGRSAGGLSPSRLGLPANDYPPSSYHLDSAAERPSPMAAELSRPPMDEELEIEF